MPDAFLFLSLCSLSVKKKRATVLILSVVAYNKFIHISEALSSVVVMLWAGL